MDRTNKAVYDASQELPDSIRAVAIDCVIILNLPMDADRSDALIDLAIKNSGFSRDTILNEMNKVLDEIKI